jgi:rubrerythrin
MNVFDFAMKMETDGKAYYEKLAAGTAIQGLRNIFTMLAGEEQKHYDIFASLKAGSTPVLAETNVLEEAKSIFMGYVAEEKFEKRAVTSNDIELEAYEHAMKIEDDSVRFYLDMAKKEKDEGVRSIMLRVAEEERKHYNIMENIYDFVLKPHYFLQWREFTNLTEMM